MATLEKGPRAVPLPHLELLDVSGPTSLRRELGRTRTTVLYCLLLQLPVWFTFLPLAPVNTLGMLLLMGLALGGIPRGDRLWVRTARDAFAALILLYLLLIGVAFWKS